MDAAARVGDRDVVAGRGDLIRGGRGREGGGDDRRTALEFLSSFVATADVPDGLGCHLQAARQLLHDRRRICHLQENACPAREVLSCVAIPNQPLQEQPILSRQLDQSWGIPPHSPRVTTKRRLSVKTYQTVH